MTPGDGDRNDHVPDRLVQAVASGDRDAADTVCRILEPPVRRAVTSFLGPDAVETDDTVQETLLAVLGYIRRRGGFQGDLVSFATTVARNRCRNILNWHQRHPGTDITPLAEWIADPARSPLDLLLETERYRLLREALRALDRACRDLLRAYYLQRVSARDLCRRLGLSTVQGVHYRKTVCLEKALAFLKRRLEGCSGNGNDGGRPSGSGSEDHA